MKMLYPCWLVSSLLVSQPDVFGAVLVSHTVLVFVLLVFDPVAGLYPGTW